MNQDYSDLLEFTALEQENLDRIKQAVRHLILLFWSQGGQKQWLDLVSTSKEIWTSLEKIPGVENPEIIQAIDDLEKRYASSELEQELESEFVRIFINTMGGISAPLYHSCYHDDRKLLMNTPAVDMAQFLEHAGMDIGPDIGEPRDHLCIELEYLFFLLDQPHARTDPDLSGHIRMFAREFMFPWIELFQQRIPAKGVGAFFAFSALAMKRIIAFLGQPAKSD
jgi:TorA maturation chaperone TorD